LRITINAFGTRGDIQPFLALGSGLQRAGHQVRLSTHKIFETFVYQHELEFFPLNLDPRQVLVSQSIADLGNNTFRILRWLRENYELVMSDIFRATLQSAQEADLLLNSSLSFAGWHVAEKLGIPAIAAYLQPLIPTRKLTHGSAPIPPDWLPFRGLYNYLSTKLTNQIFFNMLSPLTNACRKEILNLPPMKAIDYWSLDSPSGTTPIIYGYSPSVVPKPSDWGSNQQIAGYWFLDQAQDYQPPDALVNFLEGGPPPVYVGFGSMVDHERREVTQLVVEALVQSGQRAILLGGWSDLGKAGLPDNMYRCESLPHDWLFPRVAAVVHHGGAGTTAAGLRAGKPTVIVPFFGDQFFWGWQVYRLGAGPKPIPRKKLSVEKLASAIQQAVNDKSIQQSAARLGENIRSENGVEKAVRLIERYAHNGHF
jgi:sterol 3beta-glucosyltransferase